MFYCLFLFIPATNLDDTKAIFDNHTTNLVMVNICSLVESMAHTSHDRNNNIGPNYYDPIYLNYV
jgi:hypothetical protein